MEAAKPWRGHTRRMFRARSWIVQSNVPSHRRATAMVVRAATLHASGWAGLLDLTYLASEVGALCSPLLRVIRQSALERLRRP